MDNTKKYGWMIVIGAVGVVALFIFLWRRYDDVPLRGELITINDSITLIDDAGESTYYVVCGTKKALMIDTANGIDDVMRIARKITELPVEVVNTHGHVDHVYGNGYCKEAWIHKDDMGLCRKSFRYSPYKACCTMHAVDKGQIFDLGGVEVEVVEMAGHTPGSIGLLDHTHRILFSGDAVNPFIWLQLPECLSMTQFRENIGTMMETYGDDFDYILTGHTRELTPKQAVYDLLAGCDEILAGDTKDDEDYQWYGGISKAHAYGTGEGNKICYDPNNLY